MVKTRQILPIVVVALSLSGCGQYKTLPTEKRYQYIDQIKNAVDINSAGAIINGEYDYNSGPLAPSKYRVEIEGKDSYQLLTHRIKELPETKGCIESKVEFSCHNGQVDIFVTKSGSSESPAAVFELIDLSSGNPADGKK